MLLRLNTLILLFTVVAALTACTSVTDEVLDIRPDITNPRFADRDPHDWTALSGFRKPWDYPVHGIDVSKYQGEINWPQARASGVSFAFLKATEGGDRVDSRFEEYWEQSRWAKIPRGAYHFYYFCTPAAKQAAWFIRHVPKERGALPPVLDMEWNHKSPSCKFRPEPPAVRRQMTVFLNMLTRHYGQKPVIYTTVDFYRENGLAAFRDHDFWLRSVADHPGNIYPGQKWTFWQYSGTGKVPGITGDVDLNVFSSSPKDWQRWLKARMR